MEVGDAEKARVVLSSSRVLLLLLLLAAERGPSVRLAAPERAGIAVGHRLTAFHLFWFGFSAE